MASSDPRHSSKYSIHRVQAGDTLTKIAARRTGVTVADLAWLNGIRADAALRIGQSIKLPHQASLDRGRDAFGVFRGLVDYMDRHGGRIPSGPGTIVDQLVADRTSIAKNGYVFEKDGLIRTIDIQGELGHAKSAASPRNQLAAGGKDRRRSDDGGHYVARRFNGPSDPFNLFAQDSNFNRGHYRALEAKLAKFQREGKQVYVRIVPSYHGASQRPYRIEYWWHIDGRWERKRFDNEKGGGGND